MFTRFFIGLGRGDGVGMVKIFEKLSVVNIEAKFRDLPKEEKMKPLFFEWHVEPIEEIRRMEYHGVPKVLVMLLMTQLK